MKRSEINAILRDADAFLKQHQFYLPPFAYWTPEEWGAKDAEVGEIVDRRLGWDITDFGQGDYARMGLFVFTLRNGNAESLKTGHGKLYAEKILVVGIDQVTPMHFHWIKMEDIINRGGGKLVVQLYNATEDEGLADSDVTVSIDGVSRTVAAGGTVTLSPARASRCRSAATTSSGARRARVLVGEVSLVNDDNTDNRFYEPVGASPRSRRTSRRCICWSTTTTATTHPLAERFVPTEA